MSKRIMVIDNDESTRELFQMVLTGEGWEVLSYGYTNADLELVQQLKPDLLILDLNLVQAGVGWSFLQLLKMENATAAIPLVICTTASRLSLDIEGYLAAQQISVMRKPFDIDAFIQTIEKSFTPDVVLPILVVDDNEELSDNVKTILGFSGYQVATAANGQLALEALAQAQYSLILLDISMPVMNGLEFLIAYEQQPRPHSPVVIFSAQVDLLPERLPLFVMAALPKPFELSQLIALVSKYAQPVWRNAGPQ